MSGPDRRHRHEAEPHGKGVIENTHSTMNQVCASVCAFTLKSCSDLGASAAFSMTLPRGGGGALSQGG